VERCDVKGGSFFVFIGLGLAQNPGRFPPPTGAGARNLSFMLRSLTYEAALRLHPFWQKLTLFCGTSTQSLVLKAIAASALCANVEL